MSFFDWEEKPGGTTATSLWIYFAAAVPLTIMVIVSWVLCTKRSRKKSTWKLLRRATGFVAV
jgi:hypothetical protein